MKKGLILVLAIAMLLCVSISVTLAYLFVETDPVVNTFVYGDINITLEESDNLDFKMIPGNKIAKDPKVTVKAGSEACWLFVKVEKSANFDTFMSYVADTAENKWQELTSAAGENYKIYYREVDATTTDTEFTILKDNEVSVKTTVLKTELNAFDTDKIGVLSDEEKNALPKLTFTAYAVQKANVATAADAWALVATKGVPTT